MKPQCLSLKGLSAAIFLALTLLLSGICTQKSQAQCCHFTDSGQAIDSLPTFGVALGDIDNDGDPDAVTIEAYVSVNVFKNNGSGVFTNTQTLIPAAGEQNNYGVYLVNVDTDNDLDAIVIPFYNDASLKIYKNNGSGTFTLFQSVSANLGCHYAGITDIDNDGDTDVMLAGWMSATTKVFKNNGSGTFSLFSTLSLSNFGSSNDIVMADFDGDTDKDAVVVSSSMGGRLLINNGTGIFTDNGLTIGNTSDNYTCCASADMDKNGTHDLILGTMYSTISVLKNDGSGNFTLFFSAPSGNYDKHIRVADHDYDGTADIFVSNYGSNGLEVWSNDGEGNLSLCYTNAAPMPQTYSHGFDIGLINGDTYYDAFMGYFGGDGDKVFFGSPLFYATTQNAVICQGETYVLPNGTPVTQSGTYLSQFFAGNGCDSNILTTLSVTPVDTQVSYTPGSNLMLALAFNAGFQWLDCANGYAALPMQVFATFAPAQNGFYAVAVTQNGCTDTSGCIEYYYMGIENGQHIPFSVFPNPFGDVLYLKPEPTAMLKDALLMDATGRICLKINAISEEANAIDVSFLSPGLYTLIVRDKNLDEYRVRGYRIR